VRIITRYIGGGFGNKLPYYVDATLAAIGARMLRRPVKVAMTRPQVFNTNHTSQRVRATRTLGADRDGKLIAYGQDALVQSARFDTFTEPVSLAARSLYAAPTGAPGTAARGWICRAPTPCAHPATQSGC